jgi:hypothetical protein
MIKATDITNPRQYWLIADIARAMGLKTMLDEVWAYDEHELQSFIISAIKMNETRLQRALKQIKGFERTIQSDISEVIK